MNVKVLNQGLKTCKEEADVDTPAINSSLDDISGVTNGGPVPVKPTSFDSWKLANEKRGDGNAEADQGSDEEDIASLMRKRRKDKSKLKLNENKTRVGNKRISKNVTKVSTANVALNFKEEEAKWKFVASRRIADERILFDVTKKNVDIMGILEDVSVMSTVETIGPYDPYIVKEFICNMTDDVDDPESDNFQRGTLRNSTIDFSPDIINAYFGSVNGGRNRGTHVVDIPLKATETGRSSGSGNEGTAKILKDEIRHLEGVIQFSLARKSVLEMMLRSLAGEVDPEVDPDAADSEAEVSQD
ncbi:hypothetical protein LIER_16446 [Lithospermum erythrorhizon]|uniref:Envelope-like protein n=1 Tax=Lithospermum erythrorhizon TaxID=34254 RepID=A0AAV3QB66_LITER